MQRTLSMTLALLILFAFVGCSRSDSSKAKTEALLDKENVVAPMANNPQGSAGKTTMNVAATSAAANSNARAELNEAVSETKQKSNVNSSIEKTNFTPNQITDRKIIRNAMLTLELNAPAEAQRKVESIAEAHGGFTVASESTQRDYNNANGARPLSTVTIHIRVPSTQFDATVDEIRKLTGGNGGRVRSEKISGQDVTEEYVDLESRLRAQRALEAQLLEIMKRAQKVSDALEVQSELGNVRTEIERVEGRRRFLENQSSLSNISVTLEPPAPLIATTPNGFLHNLKEALSDGVSVAASITLGFLRFIIALLPVLLFIGLPVALVSRFFWRRMQRRKLAAELIASDETRI